MILNGLGRSIEENNNIVMAILGDHETLISNDSGDPKMEAVPADVR